MFTTNLYETDVTCHFFIFIHFHNSKMTKMTMVLTLQQQKFIPKKKQRMMEWIMWYWILRMTGIPNRRLKYIRLFKLMYVCISFFSRRFIKMTEPPPPRHLLKRSPRDKATFQERSFLFRAKPEIEKDKKIPLLPDSQSSYIKPWRSHTIKVKTSTQQVTVGPKSGQIILFPSICSVNWPSCLEIAFLW